MILPVEIECLYPAKIFLIQVSLCIPLFKRRETIDKTFKKLNEDNAYVYTFIQYCTIGIKDKA